MGVDRRLGGEEGVEAAARCEPDDDVGEIVDEIVGRDAAGEIGRAAREIGRAAREIVGRDAAGAACAAREQ
jgi:hypothetical protein